MNIKESMEVQGAVVCVPEVPTVWANTEYIILKVLDPVLHVIAILCFLAVAIVYFVLPPLRDLVGNMLTTIMICLIVTQAAGLVRIYTEFASHISFMVAGEFQLRFFLLRLIFC